MTTRISDTERAAWIAWCERLGIDPNDVAVPGGIERDPENRRVLWFGFARDVEGHLQLNEAGDEAVRELRFVQLEAEPPPFPAEVIHAATMRGEVNDVLAIGWERAG